MAALCGFRRGQNCQKLPKLEQIRSIGVSFTGRQRRVCSIVKADFQDSYRNLTYKAMSALSWISRHCNNTRYVLKTDDDAYVNMRALLRHLGLKHLCFSLF